MSLTALRGARILLGVSGGISAYKSADLCRRLVQAGAEVRVILTAAAREFVAPLTFETLSGRPVYHALFDGSRAWEIEHIAFARWGQVLVVAPATANTLAKLAAGLADDPLSTTALAFRGPLVLAPAMNTAMWEHPQTQENLEKLRRRGACIVAPASGELACGEVGAGRLAESAAILEAAAGTLRADGTAEPGPALAEADPTRAGALAGRRVLVTAGPTVERIDPVRFLSNASTGRMGFGLAAEAIRRGARVTLVCGPTALPHPPGVAEFVSVESARDMREAVLARLAEQDYCVFSAAVADFTPESPAVRKLKKAAVGAVQTLRLVRAPDVACAAHAARLPGQCFVGFAAETDRVEANALQKMEAKGFDLVVANEVSESNPAFAAAENEVLILGRGGRRLALARASKEDLAVAIWDFALALAREEGIGRLVPTP